MKTASVSEVEERLSELLAIVLTGETVEITDDGRPVARLIPPPRYLTPEEEEARLDRLEKAGVIKRGKGPKPKFDPFPEPITPSGVLDALLEERRNGR